MRFSIIGFENTGIARYDLANEEWLTTWDGTQGYIDDDDVTTLIPGRHERDNVGGWRLRTYPD
ncbi:MAG: hypothetical protein ACJZ5P_06675 [Candidatus Thalassarchaeaceae archaeon]